VRTGVSPQVTAERQGRRDAFLATSFQSGTGKPSYSTHPVEDPRIVKELRRLEFHDGVASTGAGKLAERGPMIFQAPLRRSCGHSAKPTGACGVHGGAGESPAAVAADLICCLTPQGDDAHLPAHRY
jgi:hypothetical protein